MNTKIQKTLTPHNPTPHFYTKHPLSFPICHTRHELANDVMRILGGEEPTTTSVNGVRELPDNFTKWLENNADRIEQAKSLPYFLRDNAKLIGGNEVASNQLQTIVNNSLSNTYSGEKGSKKDGNSNLAKVHKELNDAKIDYLPVEKLETPLTDDEIISKVGGGDLTKGSCSSAAFAYIGNKCGYDVTDFRGSDSLRYFARNGHLNKITESVGGIVVNNVNDFRAASEVLKHVEYGKEYYFGCGKHAAVIKRVKDKGFYFLELQDPDNNGWKLLTKQVLKTRFKAIKSNTLMGKKVEMPTQLIDIDLLRKDKGFQKMLGYLNTRTDKQLKGEKGTKK